MSTSRTRRTSPLMLALRKFFVSAFVIFSFIAYAVHERLMPADPASLTPQGNGSASNLLLASQQTVPTVPSPVPTSQALIQSASPTQPPAQAFAQPTDVPLLPTNTFIPTDTPLPPTATPQGQYKDGVYTGPTVDAFYGLVQVQATVQGGKLTDVQFLQYPHDRRTSQEINSQAMPWLTQEAVQAQSANVDIISGATFTSQGFAQSLATALSQAGN